MDSRYKLATLHEIALIISARMDLEKVLDAVVRGAIKLLKADSAAVLLLDETKSYLTIHHAVGLSDHVVKNTRDKLGENMAGRAALHGKPLLANNLEQDERLRNPSARKDGLLALASIPLIVQDEIIGTLDVHSRTNAQAFSQEHVEILEMLAGLAASAIDRAMTHRDLLEARNELEERVKIRTAELEEQVMERYRVEQELEGERNLLQSVIDALPDLIYVKDTGARFIIGNSTLIRTMDAGSLDKLKGRTDFDFYPEHLANDYYQDDLGVVRTGEPLINREEPNIDKSTGQEQWLLTSKIPFRSSKGDILGLVGIGRDITLLKKTLQALEERNVELDLLSELGRELQACRTEHETYGVVGDICSKLFSKHSGCLRILNPSRSFARQEARWGCVQGESSFVQVKECPAMAKLELVPIVSFRGDNPCRSIRESSLDWHVCVPLVGHEELLGTMHLALRMDINITEQARTRRLGAASSLLQRVAGHYSLFLANLRLRETLRMESIRDPLTGLYNRRHMEAYLEREAFRAKRHGSGLGLIMLDIDHFKRINDEYGHEVGDLVLRSLGKGLRENFRGEDVACRYGGEEFLIIMSGASQEDTLKRAQGLCENIRKLELEGCPVSLKFTVSAGVAHLPHDGEKVEDVLKAADKALYLAKARGRDMVVQACECRLHPVEK